MTVKEAELLIDILRAWDTFHKHLPDGEYKGLGELRLLMSIIRKRSTEAGWCPRDLMETK